VVVRVRRASHAADDERPGASVPDDELVVDAQRHPAAFAPLFDRYWDQVFRFCYYRLGDWQEAEDAAGQVFVNTLDGLRRYRPAQREDSFRCWLFTIAYNVVSNAYRHRARHPVGPLEAAAAREHPGPSPEDLAIAADDHRKLATLLSRLPEEQRELLELRLAGLTAVEIARVLGRSHDAIRKAESRAIRALRGQVNAGINAKEGIDG
jgi:RNA polymerase sigma-70 factor (ECF subfamily)